MKKHKLIWILYALMFLITAWGASADLTTDLIGAWEFDDATSTHIINKVTNTSGAYSNLFLNSSNYVLTGQSITGFGSLNGYGKTNILTSSISNSYSVSAWLYSTEAVGDDANSWFGNDGAAFNGESLVIRNGKLDIHDCLAPTSSCRATGYFASTTSISTNTWYHVVLVVDNLVPKWYINGVLDIDYSGSGKTITKNGVEYSIGSLRTTSPFRTFDGSIDQVLLYNRAITPTEILQIYNNGSGFEYPFEITSNFSITLIDKNTSASIDDFSVNVNGVPYSTTDGLVVTDLEQNASASVNLSFYNIGGGLGSETHFDFSVSNVNIGSNYEGEAEQFILSVDDVFTDVLLNGSIYARALACVTPPCSYLEAGTFTNGEYRGVLGEASSSGRTRDLIIVSDNYYNKTYDSYNMLNPLSVELTPYYYIISSSYNGLFNYSGQLYSRAFNYTLSVVCPSFINTSFVVYATNNTLAYTPNCNNETSFNIMGTYTHINEGAYNFTLGLNSTNQSFNINASTLNIISDLNAPVITAFMSVPDGFNNLTNTLTLTCNDTISPILTYEMKYNNNNIFLGNKTSNTTQTNTTSVTNGINSFFVKCTDFFGSVNRTINQNVYFKTINLIDEVDNTAFDVNNLTSARLYYDDNSSFYDFKATGTNSVNFTTTLEPQLRLELGYPENRFITRWIDVSLFDNINPIRVCANKDNIVHYEQFITSSVLKSVFLKNIYANCYVAGDKTRFAFKDGLILRAYTITGSYSLYTIEGLEQVLLASVDGAIQSDIFLDQLQFRRESFTVNILPDLISFNKVDVPEGALRIYYLNKNLDNFGLTMNIYDGSSGDLLFSESNFVNFNEANLIFNYISFPEINETTLLTLEIIKTNAEGQETTIRRYFNTTGTTGQFRPEVVSFIAFFVLLFGFTFVSAQQTFGWFGMIIGILTFGFLSFALTAWYVVFLQALSASLIIYCVIMLSKDTAGGFFT